MRSELDVAQGTFAIMYIQKKTFQASLSEPHIEQRPPRAEYVEIRVCPKILRVFRSVAFRVCHKILRVFRHYVPY